MQWTLSVCNACCEVTNGSHIPSFLFEKMILVFNLNGSWSLTSLWLGLQTHSQKMKKTDQIILIMTGSEISHSHHVNSLPNHLQFIIFIYFVSFSKKKIKMVGLWYVFFKFNFPQISMVGHPIHCPLFIYSETNFRKHQLVQSFFYINSTKFLYYVMIYLTLNKNIWI